MNEVMLKSNFEPDASTYRWIARGVNQLTRFNKLSSLPFWMPNNVTRHHQFRLILLRGMEVASTEAEDDLGVVLELIPPPSLHALPTESNMTTLQEQQTEEHDYEKKSQIKEEKKQEEQQPSSSLSAKITSEITKNEIAEIDKSSYPQGCTLTIKVFSPYTNNNNNFEKIKLQEEQQSQQQQEKLHANVQNATMSKESNNETLHLIAEATESANIDGENLQVCIPHLLSASTLQKELEMFTNSITCKDSKDVNTEKAGCEKESNSNNNNTATVLELIIEATIVVHVNIIAEHVTRSLGSLWSSVTTSMSQLWTHGTQLIHHEREEFADKNDSAGLVASSSTNKEIIQKKETQDTHGSVPVMNEADSHVSGWFRSTLAKTVTASTAESLFANALSTIQHVVDVNNSNTNAATNQNKSVHYSDKIKNVGEETSLYTSITNNQQMNELPWNNTPPKWIGRVSDWKELIGTHIITDDGTFLYGPPTTWSQDHKALILQMGLPYKAITCDFVNDVNKSLPIHSGLLTNEALSKKRYELVPKKIDEEKFWRNYFWKVKCLSLCDNEESVKLLLSILNAPNSDNTTTCRKCTEIKSTLVSATDNAPEQNLIVDDKLKNNNKMVAGKKSSQTQCLQEIERELIDANEAADLLKEYLEDIKRKERHYKSDNDEMLMINTTANEYASHLEEITNYIRSRQFEQQEQCESECSTENSEVYKKAQDMQRRLHELLEEYEKIKVNSDDKETYLKDEETKELNNDEEHTVTEQNVEKSEVDMTNNESTATCEKEKNTAVQNEQILKEGEQDKIVNEANKLTAPHNNENTNLTEEKQTSKKNDHTKISIDSKITFAKMPWEEEDEEDVELENRL